MAQHLGHPAVPLSISSGHIYKDDRTFTIRCPDRLLRDGIMSDDQDNKIFDCGGVNPLTSWNLRRNLTDTSGRHLLTLKHYNSLLKQWVLEDTRGKEICRIKDVSKLKITALEARVHMESGEVLVCMRSFDVAGTRTAFQVGDVMVAQMIVTDNNDVSFLGKRGLDRTAWELDVAGGVDIALIAALAFIRAEVMHSRRR